MNSLFATFDKQTKAKWLEQVTKDLKGKAIEELDWKLGAGIRISPFAHQEDFESLYTTISNNKKTNTWESGVLLKVSDFTSGNTEALELLQQGANALCFELDKTPSKEELNTLLENIQHEWISTHFVIQQESWKRLSEHFLAIVLEKGQNPQIVNCSFEVKGSSVSEVKEVAHFQDIYSRLPKACFLAVNTCTLFSNKQEVVDALATTIFQGNHFLEQFNQQDFDVKVIHPSIQFSISLTDSYFLNIATLRALRLLWQQVLHGWDSQSDASSPIVVHLGSHSQTEDEHYNKIKATAQAMSAVLGGADRLYIYPSDDFKQKGGTVFSRRIALNIHHLMELESYLDRVVDPAAGSYYLENLTQRLAEAAWKGFQQKQKNQFKNEENISG